jgi:hypothetical protein
MKIIIILLIISALIIALLAYLTSPGRYLYAIGNQKWNNRLAAFGFVKPLPDGFLHPQDLLLRLFPGSGILVPVDEQKERMSKFPDFIEIEYMPDHTHIELWEKPHGGQYDPQTLIDEQTLYDWIARAIGKPKYYSKILAGKEYKCVEVQTTIGAGMPDGQKRCAVKAVCYVQNPPRLIIWEIHTPGNKINFDCVNKLLDGFKPD